MKTVKMDPLTTLFRATTGYSRSDNVNILTSLPHKHIMIIHCISCGKSISSHGHCCPYCTCELNDLTYEFNGIEEKANFKERMRNMVFGLVHK